MFRFSRHAASTSAMLSLFVAAAAAQTPTMSLQAVEVNGRPVTPTDSVTVRPGATVVVNLRISDWSAYGDDLRTYQAGVNMEGFRSGDEGMIVPLGWDRPIEHISCYSDADCPAEWPMCHQRQRYCAGPDHEPDLGIFIDTARSDYPFYGLEFIAAVNTRDYILGNTLFWPEEAALYSPPPKCGATLILEVSDDALGTFTIDFNDLNERGNVCTFLANSENHHILPLNLEPLTITVQPLRRIRGSED